MRAALILLFNGPNAEIPAGIVVTAYVDRNTAIVKEGEKIEKSDNVILACEVAPADENAYIRILLNGRIVASQKGSPGKVEVTFTTGTL